MYTTSDDVPRSISEALEETQGNLTGLSIPDMLSQLSFTLQEALDPQKGNMVDESEDEEGDGGDVDGWDSDIVMDDDDDDGDGDSGMGFSDEEYGWSPRPPQTSGSPTTSSRREGADSDMAGVVRKLSADLKEAKFAGFRVGYLGNEVNPIVCVSFRLSALDISEEAMQAWKVNEDQYLVCLIRYIGRYRSLEQILHEDERFGKTHVEVRVDLCDSYKPTLVNALQLFGQQCEGSSTTADDARSYAPNKPRKMVRSFISKPLKALMNERFIKILRYRHSYGLSWSGAEQFFNDYQGKSITSSEPLDSKYIDSDHPTSASAAAQSILASDHLVDHGPGASFPLIAMQFALRHFVRCTEFCLVCHCKTNDAFEALRPYVCSKSLCLYQYMALGLGPSLEWEIKSQPYVTDLLISFTYVSACGGRLNDFPTGLGFLVPSALLHTDVQKPGTSEAADVKGYRVMFERSKMSVKFEEGTTQLVRAGDWVVLTNFANKHIQLHCRVRDASVWPMLELSEPIVSQRPSDLTKSANEPMESGYIEARLIVYDQNFDELELAGKRTMIMILLNTLPSVEDMAKYLNDTFKGSPPTLTTWRDRISNSALDVLRWIVASNRSCIIQDDPDPVNRKDKRFIPHSGDNRIGGMVGYMQFRFAQGAPDKEHRFVQSVAVSSANKKHPTLFAWHGSSLANWHGILREGLHFKDTLHGRAYGNGVYMSPDFNTSLGYTGASWRGDSQNLNSWGQSKLGISTAISLNEVVNAPAEFTSNSPHYVVSQLDWIQTRYLFVKCTAIEDNANQVPRKASNSVVYYAQDPHHVVKGLDGKATAIPMTAFSQQRRLALSGITQPEDSSNEAAKQPPAPEAAPQPKKRAKLFSLIDKTLSVGSSSNLNSTPSNLSFLGVHGGGSGDDTDTEDLTILLRCDEDAEPTKKGKEVAQQPNSTSFVSSALNKFTSGKEAPKTDFIPGTLDSSTLSLLAAPSYATPSATKSLQRDLKTTLQAQETQPPHELGWYIDPNLINTVYQWIVELHSFDPKIPLTNDLKKANLKSIVLELRFPKEYPISPPFVRVIRPRFLGFQQGGGGHVTAGGALCMELLTNSGWSAVSSIESVLLQVRMAIQSTDPQAARLESGQNANQGSVREYSVPEAVDAYVRSCRMHGWEVPKDFEQSTRNGWMPN